MQSGAASLTKKHLVRRIIEGSLYCLMKAFKASSYDEALEYNKRQKFFFSEEETILYYGSANEKMWQGQNLAIDFYSHDSNLIDEAKRSKQYKRVFSKIEDIRIQDYTTLVAFGTLQKEEAPFHTLLKFRGTERICLMVPNAKSLHRYLNVRMGLLDCIDALDETDLILGHKHSFTPESFEEMLREFCEFTGHQIYEYGSMCLKLGNEDQMKGFTNAAMELEDVAENAGIIGQDKFLGTELYCELSIL